MSIPIALLSPGPILFSLEFCSGLLTGLPASHFLQAGTGGGSKMGIRPVSLPCSRAFHGSPEHPGSIHSSIPSSLPSNLSLTLPMHSFLAPPPPLPTSVPTKNNLLFPNRPLTLGTVAFAHAVPLPGMLFPTLATFEPQLKTPPGSLPELQATPSPFTQDQHPHPSRDQEPSSVQLCDPSVALGTW